jgi:hypothetical protein
MEEASEDGKDSPNSAHANGMNEVNVKFSLKVNVYSRNM